MASKKRWFFISLIVVLFLIANYFLYTSDILSNTDQLVSLIEGYGAWSYIVFVLIVIAEILAAPIPGLIIYTAGGIIFGVWLGGTLALIGNIIGASIAFFLARKFGDNFSFDIDEKKQKLIDKFSDKYGGYTMFLLRVNPFTSTDIFSYLAGFTKMKYFKFILGTTLGLAPFVYLQAYFGSDIILQNKTLVSVFVTLSIFYLIGIVYLILKLLYKKTKKK